MKDAQIAAQWDKNSKMNNTDNKTAAILEVLQKHGMGDIPYDEFVSMWFPHLVDAMTEFAATEAQQFAEWCLTNDWFYNSAREDWWPAADFDLNGNKEYFGTPITTTELYNLYSEWKEKQG